jgi:hypothetical protein
MKQLNYEQADPRAQKFFHTVFVGTSCKGADSSGHKRSWDSDHEELAGTPCHAYDVSGRYCVFCGAHSLPIQGNLRRVCFKSLRNDSDYKITDWTCVCKEAMDWLEVAAEVKALEEKYELEKEKLLATRPKFNQQVSVDLVRKASEYQIKQLQDGWTCDFSSLGITLAER